jgi:Uma2 family endonuclease
MATKVMMPLAEFDEIVEPDHLRQELDEGVLLTMTRPRAKHNRIWGTLYVQFALYFAKNPIGEAFPSDQMYTLGPDTKRAPDVSVVLKPRIVAGDQDLEGAPDIAIEVMSPHDSPTALHRKLKQYFAAGCRTAIVIYPDSREVEIWSPPGLPDVTLTTGDQLTLPLLPGFTLPVAALFAE